MIFFDTETTGLLSPSLTKVELQPFITEIYAIRLDENFNFVNEINTLVKPPIPIPEIVTKLTGITDDHVKDAPAFIEIYDSLCELFIGERELVAHNASFDVNVLRWELTRHNFELKFPWPIVHTCTVEKSYSIENRRLKLSDLHLLATGKEHSEKAHRAKEDVMALIRSYIWLKKEGYV